MPVSKNRRRKSKKKASPARQKPPAPVPLPSVFAPGRLPTERIMNELTGGFPIDLPATGTRARSDEPRSWCTTPGRRGRRASGSGWPGRPSRSRSCAPTPTCCWRRMRQEPPSRRVTITGGASSPVKRPSGRRLSSGMPTVSGASWKPVPTCAAGASSPTACGRWASAPPPPACLMGRGPPSPRPWRTLPRAGLGGKYRHPPRLPGPIVQQQPRHPIEIARVSCGQSDIVHQCGGSDAKITTARP